MCVGFKKREGVGQAEEGSGEEGKPTAGARLRVVGGKGRGACEIGEGPVEALTG
jgi:hypothetical protein